MIILAATPLGNPADASQRLRDLLGSADVVAAEDTRRVRRLAANLGVTINGRVMSFFEAVEESRIPALLEAAREQVVLVVSDAGTPLISDPGYRLVAGAVDHDVPVGIVPGPSAVTAALAVSGLPTDRFCFEGFLPRKPGARRRRLNELAPESRTMVFFESPRRTAATLADMAAAFGAQRRAVLCRELTKTHEEVVRADLGTLRDLAAAREVLGEVTLVVAGHDPSLDAPPTPEELAGEVERLEAAGTDRKAAIASVASGRGLPKRLVYDAVVRSTRPQQ